MKNLAPQKAQFAYTPQRAFTIGGTAVDREFAFEVGSVLPEIREKGFALLPGYTDWLARLNPLNHRAAWKHLEDPAIQSLIHNAPQQDRHFELNDDGELVEGSLCIQHIQKPSKSHLTVIEGGESIIQDISLPQSLTNYLERCYDFLSACRTLLDDLVQPGPILPTRLKLRIFMYRGEAETLGMREHVDGSYYTLIIGESDACLSLLVNGVWRRAIRPGGAPFALLIPGIAAMAHSGIAATPHQVHSCTGRISVTAFLSPDFGSVEEEAKAHHVRLQVAAERQMYHE